MGKTPLIVAPVIVAAALLYLALWFGRWWERAAARARAEDISPELYGDLVAFVRGLLNPTDLTDVAYLPGPARARAEELVSVENERDARRRRAERRRAGY